jgi:hypothetical protein
LASLVGLGLLTLGGAATAEPLRPADVPAPLQDWTEWVLRGHESETCPPLQGRGQRNCLWPTRLALDLGSRGGSFVQDLVLDAAGHVTLPGGRGEPGAWPEKVTSNGVRVAVFERQGVPLLRLKAGRHRLRGSFSWAAPPPVLRIPPATGLVELRLDGERAPAPRRDAQGRLWLRERGDGQEADRTPENRIEVDVQRRISDANPLELTTRIVLQISGASREARLGPALPAGLVPIDLVTPIPARLDPDGTLQLQARAGRFVLELHARHEGPVAELAPPARGELVWDDSEVWVFEARPELRLVEVAGVEPVDPTQTRLPDDWKHLPAYRVDPGDVLQLEEKRRGNEGGPGDRLSLQRSWHLDFDGAGATVSDSLSGTLRNATRLEMGSRTALGRAAVNGEEQPITRRSGGERDGVEVPLGSLQLEADSRVAGSPRVLPAVGWDHDFEAVAGALQLPPGWRLFHASGADQARPTWVGRWSTLDVFLVLLATVFVHRLFGRASAALALAALALSYTEPNAPHLLWLWTIAAEALHRTIRNGRFAPWASALRVAALGLLVIVAVPFAAQQLRDGLFPALERPGAADASFAVRDRLEAPMEPEVRELQEFGDAATEESFRGGRADAPARPKAPSAATSQVARHIEVGSLTSKRYRYAPDPNATVPTGPGRPEWQWRSVVLSWSGPVERGQELHLWLIPPWLNGVLAILRTGLLAALVLVFLVSRTRRSAGATPGATRALLLLALLPLSPQPAWSEFPQTELLEELRSRLLEPPECLPQCAAIPRLGLGVRPERLDLRMTVEAAAETAIPLPGSGHGEAGFRPARVLVDGSATAALFRGDQGRLWVRLSAGTHDLTLSGPLPPRETLELALPVRPHRVELISPPLGWTLQGLNPDGSAEGALRLIRVRDAAEAEEEEGELEPTPIPPFARVERVLQLGLEWHVQTHVQRVAPRSGPVVLEVPLLPGESVTTPGVRVESGRVLVSLAPGQAQTTWTSLLAPSAVVSLSAETDAPWAEVWRVDPSPQWHVEASGIPPVDAPAAGRRLRSWQPWPGEGVELRIERPVGVAGGTLTVDRALLALAPGARATDATLTLQLRSSRGGQHAVTLPEGAVLRELSIDDRVQPARQEGRLVTLPIAPGPQQIVLQWREPLGLGTRTSASPVALGVAGVNARVEMRVPDGRWTLAVGGPRLGPVVLFWPSLVLLAGLAFGLGRLDWTPLRGRHWLGLGLGMTQAPLWAGGCVVLWLLALGWRKRVADRLAGARPLAFDALQLALVGLTLAAFVSLLWAIEVGLLGSPEMRIAGNGSSASSLRWYQDRFADALPTPWLFSVSIWFYRGVMLVWSFWMALSLVRWLRWGWQCFTTGAGWLPLRAQPPTLDPTIPQDRP